jgi:hypothetical protein
MAGTIIMAGTVVGIIVATGDGIADGITAIGAGITAIGAGITGAGTVTGKLFALKPKQARLVVRFQHSHPIAASTFANVGIKGPLENIDSSGALDLTFACECAAGR